MPAFTFSEGERSLLKLWGSIVKAANAGTGAAGAWNEVKASGYVTGPGGGGASAIDMNRLYGLAVANRNAMQAFGAASEGQAITSDMIGLTPNAREPAARGAAAAYNVRVNYTAIENGQLVSDWVTVQYPTELVGTVTTFMDTLRSRVTTLVTGYGRTLGTLLGVSINAY